MDIAQALGVKLYQPEWIMPRYKESSYGRWRIQSAAQGLAPGYFTSLWYYQNLPVLTRQNSEGCWETWMSLTPYELESQEAACRYAYGDCVVLGLGMGWVAINMAANQQVTSVTVVEFDSEVIELFKSCADLSGVPEEIRQKITIIQADALSWQPAKKVDFLYADIWLYIDEKQTVEQMLQIQRNIQAEKIYFWGQEFPLWRAANGIITGDSLQKAAEIIGLPLLLPSDYPAMIYNLVANRKSRGQEM